jgi:hypothetical protein
MNQIDLSDTLEVLKKIQELTNLLINQLQDTPTKQEVGETSNLLDSNNSLQAAGNNQSSQKASPKKELYYIYYGQTLVAEDVVRSRVALKIAEHMATVNAMSFEEIKQFFIDEERYKTSKNTIIRQTEHSLLADNVKWRYHQSTKTDFCVWGNWFLEQGALKEGNFRRLEKIVEEKKSNYRIVRM